MIRNPTERTPGLSKQPYVKPQQIRALLRDPARALAGHDLAQECRAHIFPVEVQGISYGPLTWAVSTGLWTMGPPVLKVSNWFVRIPNSGPILGDHRIYFG